MGQRIVGLSPFAAIVSALAVILVIAFGLRLAQRARDFDGAFAVLVAMTAVLNPIAWPHYLVLLIFPASVYLCRAKTSVRGPLIIMIGALLTSLLFFLTIETLPRPLAVLLVYAPLLVTMTLAYLNQRSSSARPSAETAQLPAPPTID